MKFLGPATLVALLVAGMPARAAEISAIVEEAGDDAPVQVFSYLQTGDVIDLGAETEIVLGYLNSCVQERLRGGVVTVGKERSQLQGGQRWTEEFDCGSVAVLSQSEVESGAALVVRELSPDEDVSILVSASPLIAPKHPTLSIRFTRLDHDEPTTTLETQNGVFDFAALDVALSPGGTYLFESETDSVVVRVDENARAGDGPILLRLLSF